MELCRLTEIVIRAKGYYKAVDYEANDRELLIMISEMGWLENRASEILERLIEGEEEPECVSFLKQHPTYTDTANGHVLLC